MDTMANNPMLGAKAGKRGHVRSPLENGIRDRGKVREVMHEFKHGELHSGSHTGPVVTDRKQAVAIALNSARKKR